MVPEIRCVVQGHGHPIVLLHAFPLSHSLFEGLEPPPGYQWIWPDFPGFGLSPTVQEDLILQEAAQGLENALKSLGINEKIALGGISMGGYWAFEYLRLFPKKVEHLILISTRGGVDRPEGRQNRLIMAERVLRDGVEFLVGSMTPGLLGTTTRSQKPVVVDRLAGWIREAKPQGVATAQRAMAQRRDQTDLLRSLRMPTLILAGREDSLIPSAEAEAMAQLIPGSRLEIFERSGHLIPLEEPQAFKNSIQSFLVGPRE